MSLLPHPPLGFKKQHHKNTNEILKSQEFCKKNIGYYRKLLIYYVFFLTSPSSQTPSPCLCNA